MQNISLGRTIETTKPVVIDMDAKLWDLKKYEFSIHTENNGLFVGSTKNTFKRVLR